MKKLLALAGLGVATVLLAGGGLQAGEPVPGFVDLFNGKDLTGWVNVNTDPDTWSVKDGVLVCTGQPIGVMRSEKQYENFVLHIEWKHMEAGGTPGSSSGATPSRRDNRLPNGVEVQMLELDWVKLNTRDGKVPPIAYVHGEVFGVGGVEIVPDTPRGKRSKSDREPLQGTRRVEHLRRRGRRRRRQARGQRQVRQRDPRARARRRATSAWSPKARRSTSATSSSWSSRRASPPRSRSRRCWSRRRENVVGARRRGNHGEQGQGIGARRPMRRALSVTWMTSARHSGHYWGMSPLTRRGKSQGRRLMWSAMGGRRARPSTSPCGGARASRRASGRPPREWSPPRGSGAPPSGPLADRRRPRGRRGAAPWDRRCPATRGAPIARVKSGSVESATVARPAFSISRCTSPTDRQQNGQTGTRSTASTSSAFICSIIAGVERSSSSFSFRM